MPNRTVKKRRRSLSTDFATYRRHATDLLQKHQGEYALIHGLKVYGTYASQEDAMKEAAKSFGRDLFLIMHIVPPKDEGELFFGQETA